MSPDHGPGLRACSSVGGTEGAPDPGPINHTARAEAKDPTDDQLELLDVARPGCSVRTCMSIGGQKRDGRCRTAGSFSCSWRKWLTSSGRSPSRSRSGGTQRERPLSHVEERRGEPPSSNLALQVLPRAEDEPDIHPLVPSPSHGPEHAGREDLGQLVAELSAQMLRIAQVEGAAIGRLQEPGLFHVLPRAATPGSTEQESLQQLLRDRGAVEGHERL